MTPTTQAVTYGLATSIAQFSVDSYQRMIETGIIKPEDKVELLENWVVLKMSKNPPHEGCIDLLKGALCPLIFQGWIHRVQQTIVLQDSQPEPDFTIVRGTYRSFLQRHPTAHDVGLVIEVADSSLLRDQRDKTRIYARGGLDCYWIVNLVDQRIEVYTKPSGPIEVPAYQSFQIYQRGDALPFHLDGTLIGTVAVNELLP